MSKDKRQETAIATKVGEIPAFLPEELVPAYEWYINQGRSWLTSLAIALLVALSVMAFMRYRNSKTGEAAAALATAEGVESLENLNAQYGRSKVGPMIRLALAKAHFEADNYGAARTAFEEFLKRDGNHEMAAIARLGLAATLESGQEFEEALKAFETFAADFPAPHYLNALAVMGGARCLAALQRKDEALDRLDRLIAVSTDRAWEGEARALRPVIERFEGFKVRSIFDQLGAASQELTGNAASLDEILDAPIRTVIGTAEEAPDTPEQTETETKSSTTPAAATGPATAE